MLNVEENVFFKFNVVILLVVDDNVLPNALHCIDSVGVRVLHEENFAECAFAHHFHDNEVGKLHSLLIFVENQLSGGNFHALERISLLVNGSYLAFCWLLGFIFIVVVIICIRIFSEVLALLVLLVSEVNIFMIVVKEGESGINHFDFNGLCITLSHNVFASESELSRRIPTLASFHIFLCSCELSQVLLFDSEDGQVDLLYFQEPSFDYFNNFVSPRRF